MDFCGDVEVDCCASATCNEICARGFRLHMLDEGRLFQLGWLFNLVVNGEVVRGIEAGLFRYNVWDSSSPRALSGRWRRRDIHNEIDIESIKMRS